MPKPSITTTMLHKNRIAVDQALARISDTEGQGSRTFTRVYADAARLAADTADAMGGLGLEQPPLSGVLVSVKDLFDLKGEVTLAGSRALMDSTPADQDAEVVRRLRCAGAAIIGKTNMTEFAFSGLGLNPHYGTPLNSWDRAGARIPGGSSSGAAISITDGMAQAAIGTDTGGSCRIPAALNGIVGMKPSAQSVPMAGAFPLSYSYDSIGPMAADVEMCARVYAVLCNGPYLLERIDPCSITLGIVGNYVLDGMDATVGRAYESALQRLSRAGVAVRELTLPVLDELPSLFTNGGLVAAEAYQRHRELLEAREAEYDPRVSSRIRRGAAISSADYIDLKQLRHRLMEEWSSQTRGRQMVLMPTVPVVAPKISDLNDDEAYQKANLLMLRNPTIANALNGCSVSIPCHDSGEAPVGLMLMGANGNDWRLLSIAQALEEILKACRSPH